MKSRLFWQRGIGAAAAAAVTCCLLWTGCQSAEPSSGGDASHGETAVSEAPASAAPTETTTTAPPTQAPSTQPPRPTAQETVPANTPVNPGDRYIQPAGAPWNLLLVNPWNKGDASYYDDVVKNHVKKYPTGGQFDDRAMQALKDMLEAAKGTQLQAGYLFRTAQRSAQNLERKANTYINKGMSEEEAYVQAATVIAPPYTSEHNFGLAVDLIVPYQSHLIQDFDKTEAFAWLQEHCAEYGFILRYPKDKQEITGIIYEPWHYRYVGEEHAREIMSRGITLEEYLEEKGW
jgi:D-alanyl-D-alanine carboxypeptidase